MTFKLWNRQSSASRSSRVLGVPRTPKIRWTRWHLYGLALLTLGISSCSAMRVREQPRRAAAPKPAEIQKPSAPTPPKPAPIREATLEDQPFRVEDLKVAEDKGQTTVSLKFATAVSQYRHFPLTQPSRIVLDVFGEARQLPKVESFQAETHWVSTLRLSSGQGYLRAVIEITAASVPPYTVDLDNGGLKVVIGQTNPAMTAKKDLSLVARGKRVDIQVAEAKPTAEKPTPTESPEPPQPPAVAGDQKTYTGDQRTYKGERISLDFKDADIKNVFRLLAEISGLNIIITPEVQRKVTVRLVDVPWDQALDLIVETNGLGQEKIGNVLRISGIEQLRRESDLRTAAQKAKEGEAPLETAFLNINYAKAKELEPKVKPLLSPRGNLIADDRSNTLFIRDIRKSIDDATSLVSRLDTRTPQVLIESNLIETTPTFARSLGMRLDFDYGDRSATVNADGSISFTGRMTRIFSEFPAGAPATGNPFVSLVQSKLGPLENVAAFLTAAEQEGNIKIISRPSVVTLNNVESTISSLRIIRVTLPSSTNIASGTGAAAGAAVATEKINIGIVLTVNPQVSADGFVLMNIKVKSSSVAESATASGGGVLPFDELSREATANVLVRDGETVVIGGIMKDTSATSSSGIPYLKDIPIFGWLFKNIRWQKDFEELMVFITPRVLAGGSGDLPTAEQLWREQMRKTEGG